MTSKEKARDAVTPQAQEQPTTASIPSKAELVKMAPVRRIRLSTQTPSADMVQTLRQLYPGFDASLLSKVERPHQYGVELCEPGMLALYAAYAPLATPKRRKPSRRRLPCRIYGRLSEGAYSDLQEAIKADGYRTMQDWLLVMVRKYLAAKREGQE